MNRYHITWVKPSSSLDGIILNGKTYNAGSMSEALNQFNAEFKEIGEPLYIINQGVEAPISEVLGE